jgi:hypothetical protein
MYMEIHTLKPEVSEIGMFDIISYYLNYTLWLIHKQYRNNNT